jgi:anti-sigma factor ChrR (cupin superfamily)
MAGGGGVHGESIAGLLAGMDRISIEWERFRDGIEIVRLANSIDSGPAAALLRYQPGAQLPRHRHVGWEYVLVLSGAQSDDRGRHAVGEMLVHPPGSSHSITSDEGCVVLIIWEKPVAFEGHDAG